MNHKILKRWMLACAFCVAGTASAQLLNSSYFSEGNTHRHELNPAFEPDRGYLAMPIYGNLYMGLRSNIGLENIFYKRNGNLVSYLHPDVSYSEAMDGFADKNKMLFDLKANVIDFGFRGFGGFNTFSINARARLGFMIPKGLLQISKLLENKDYNIDGLGMRALGYGEIALGHSHQINDKLRIGAKVKFLLGGAYFNVETDQLQMNLQDDNKWTIKTHAQLEGCMKGLEFKSKPEEYSSKDKEGQYYDAFDDIEVDGAGLGGFGMAFDLGAEYDLKDVVPGLKVSAALLDIGFINMKDYHKAETSGEAFEFDGFQNIKVEGEGVSIEDQMDDLSDDLVDLYNLEVTKTTGSKTVGLGATLNLAAEYALPVYDKLRFGLLSTTRIDGNYSWNEERLSANIAPVSFFDANVNLGVGTFGTSFGWLINLHPGRFNMFFGMDHMITKMSKQYVPLKFCADICIGVNFTFGKSKAKKEKQAKLYQTVDKLYPTD